MLTTHLWRLGQEDTAALQRLLDEDPLQNVYLRSELRVGGVSTGQWWGLAADGRLRATLLGGPLVVPWVPDLDDARRLAEGMGRQQPVRMLVGPRDQVVALHRARPDAPTPRELRDPQPFLVLRRGALRVRPAPEVRRGTPHDLDRLTVAAADMHREEMGVDPLAIDPAGWRTRMSTLVQRGWSWVWTEDGEVIFKAELSGWTPEAVQIQGVYTAPHARNRGIASAALAAVCRDMLEQVSTCTLYVNHYNAAARALYHRLGFEHHADFATLLY
jgi:ribosomal protein S18 acetylase RimI-like enzyme